MTFILGLLCGAVFFAFLFAAYKAGQRVQKPPNEVTDEERRKAEETRKHFLGLMNYDVNTATRKKVT